MAVPRPECFAALGGEPREHRWASKNGGLGPAFRGEAPLSLFCVPRRPSILCGRRTGVRWPPCLIPFAPNAHKTTELSSRYRKASQPCWRRALVRRVDMSAAMLMAKRPREEAAEAVAMATGCSPHRWQIESPASKRVRAHAEAVVAASTSSSAFMVTDGGA